VSQPLEEGRFEALDPSSHAAALHDAVERYQRDQSPATLNGAFAAAAVAVAALRAERAGVPPDLEEVRRLFERLPDFELLVSIAAGEADRAASAGGARVWQWLGFPGSSPSWDEAELARARLLVACACAPLDGRGAQWLGPRLRRLAAARWAELIVDALSTADEDWWQGALGERYESVRQRCAPRTTWRVRGLAVLTSDERTRETLRARLERWLAAGAELERLPDELEASLVQSRTPPRVA
jgi:hypothetical protein